jgi:hypothetical protein
MADIEVRQDEEPEDFENWEMVYWIFGILMLPLAPILMIWFLTPWSGM